MSRPRRHIGSISRTSPKLEKKALIPSGVKCSAASGEAQSRTQVLAELGTL
jgi:hypothetical protein